MNDLRKSFLVKGNSIVGSLGDKNFSTLHIGCIIPYLGKKDNVPRGYLLADGASYKTTDYPELFNIIGYIYGGSDDTFNVPNLCDGRFLEGSNISGGYVEAGLPNIEGEWIANSVYTPYFEGTLTGAFSVEDNGQGVRRWGSNEGNGKNTFLFDASKSNPIYGNADTVQPKSLRVLYIIKAFHTNEGIDSKNEVSDPIIEYVESEIVEVENKIGEKYEDKLFSYTGGDYVLEIQLDDRKIDIEVVDNCGGKIELLGNGAIDNSVNYRFMKVLRLSYGNWTEFDATKPNDTYTKIKEVYVDTTNKKAYVYLKGNANYIVKGAKSVISKNYADIDTSTMTLIPESKYASINNSATNTTSTWSSSKIDERFTSTYLIKDIAPDGENEKTVSFKIRKDYFSSYYAKRTFLLSANIYSLGFSKPVISLVEIFRSSNDNYGGYIVNLQGTRFTGVTVTVNGDYLEIVVTFNSYESSGAMVSCSSLSNAPIA